MEITIRKSNKLDLKLNPIYWVFHYLNWLTIEQSVDRFTDIR